MLLSQITLPEEAGAVVAPTAAKARLVPGVTSTQDLALAAIHAGQSQMTRNGRVIWAKPFLSGEARAFGLSLSNPLSLQPPLAAPMAVSCL